MREAIRFYCGIGERQWNHHPVAPGPFACISPVYGNTVDSKRVNRVFVPDGVEVIQDSGAFSDGFGQRLDFGAALDRQIEHAEQYGYADKVTHRASYDVLIDEKWIGGVRYKARWDEQDAELAVKMTVNAARYLNQHRQGVAVIFSAQGVTSRQYLSCTEQIMHCFQDGDIFGLGGFCVTGKKPAQIMPGFRETVQAVVPFLAREGIKRAHIWGVTYAPALGELLYLCDQHGIALSTDSAWPSIKPCKGDWGYSSWRDNTYRRPEPEIRGLERARHVEATRDWLNNFRERESQFYRFIPVIPRKDYYQTSWLEEVAR